MIYRPILKSLSAKYASYALQLISLTILARFFSPKQFGIIASIQVFYVFFQVLGEVGFGPAIISLEQPTKRELGGLLLVSMVLSAGLACTFWLLTKTFVRFYGDPLIAEVMPFAAGGVFFSTALIVPTGLLNREMRFYHLALASIFGEILSTVTTISLVSVIGPVKALACKMFVGTLCQCLVTWLMCRQTEHGIPLFALELSGAKKIAWFSLNQFAFSFVNYFSRNLDNILVGRFMGAISLGIYDKAYQLMKYPLNLVTSGMLPAIQPALKAVSYDLPRIETIHREFVYKLSWAGLAAGVIVVSSAPVYVKVILGHQWISAVPIIRELALSVPVQVVTLTLGSFFHATCRPDILFRSGVLSASTIVVSVAVGIHSRDLILMSWLLSLSFYLNFLQSYYLLYRFAFRASPWIFFRAIRAQLMLNFLLLIGGSPLFIRMFSDFAISGSGR